MNSNDLNPVISHDGLWMHKLATELFPIGRSLTGDGVRQTFSILKRELPALTTFEVLSGTQCLDWTVPNEWNIEDAYVLDPNGQKIIDFKKSNLHVVGYSIPVDQVVSLDELQTHLHSLPEQPEAIPYVTSYYQERWGFCISHNQRRTLTPGQYRVVIRSTLKPGSLTYGEWVIPGQLKDEIFLSTYICHPSMGNNELSGPVVQTMLAKWIAQKPRRYSYRLVFIPETIGSIVYLAKNLSHLKTHVVAGFNITCVGDDRCYSYLPTRYGRTLADRVVLHTLTHTDPRFVRYSFLDRGSDERQYCSPGVDLPVASLMRSKYGTYPEYHTSLDNLDLITPQGLFGAYQALKRCLEIVESNEVYLNKVVGEPQMGKRGLYPTLSVKDSTREVTRMMDLLTYCDGQNDLLAVADLIGAPVWELLPLVEKLQNNSLIQKV